MVCRSFRKFIPALSALIAAFGMAGCVLDKSDRDEIPAPVNGEEITITVNIHGQQAPATRSIDGYGGEAVVDVINLLVFENTGAGEVLAEHVQGTIIDQSTDKDDNYKVRFKAALTPNANAKTLAVVANAAAEVDAAVNAGGIVNSAYGTSKAAILAALIHPETAPTDFYWNANNGNSPSETAVAGVDYTPIPMYGEYDVTKGGTNTAGITKGMKMQGIDMVRMVARIDVVNDAAGFTLTDIYIVNFNDSGYIAPAWGLGGTEGALMPNLPSTPMVPPTAGKVTGEGGALHYAYPNGIDSLTGEIFIYEAAATTGVEGTSGHTDAVCLIVAGTLDSAPNTPYYYRIDFTAGTDGNDKTPGETEFDPFDVKYMPVYRNHRYAFTIGAVNDVGYGSFDEALASLGILNNLRTELLIIDESGLNNTVFNGRNHLSLEEEATIGYAVGNTATSACVTDYNGGWHITGIEYPDPSNAGWLAAVKAGSAGDMRSAINLTATQDNVSITGRTAYVNVEAGVLSGRLKVTQTGLPAVLNVTPPAGFNYMGGTQTFTVESVATATVGGGTTTLAVPWITEFSEDGGQTWTSAAPPWLTAFPVSGAGGSTTESMTAAAFAGGGGSSPDAILRAATPRGSSSAPYDLSTKGDKALMNTANCYIVNAAGYYKLPLVYGNAVKDGATNPGSYSTAKVNNVLKVFLQHNNGPIAGPYIYEQFTPANAVLVWMDAQDLIANVALTDGGKSLRFEIPEASVAQGNAIVAVRDIAGVIMWSWHIWVTPLVSMDNPATDKVVNFGGVTYNMMQYNLGWCSTGTGTYYGDTPRHVKVRIRQSGVTNPLAEEFTVTQQNGFVPSAAGNGPYWQWGRKDPMLPSNGMTNTDKEHYATAGYSFTKTQGSVSIGNSIRSPHTIYYGNSSDWLSSGGNKYYNLWSADNTRIDLNDDIVVKTIYDPSPVGFTIPAPNAWTGFARQGSVYDTWDNGWNFYTVYGSNDAYTFYPGAGFRLYDSGTISNVNSLGFYWSATPSNAGSHLLRFSSALVSFQSDYARNSAFSVRCSAER